MLNPYSPGSHAVCDPAADHLCFLYRTTCPFERGTQADDAPSSSAAKAPTPCAGSTAATIASANTRLSHTQTSAPTGVVTTCKAENPPIQEPSPRCTHPTSERQDHQRRHPDN